MAVNQFFDTKISIVSIVGWIFAILTFSVAVSTTYGENRQKISDINNRQMILESRLDAFDQRQRDILLSIARIETLLKTQKR